MSEYVVVWRHLRPCGATADSLLSLWLQGLLTEDELRDAELARLGILPGFDPLCTNGKWASVKLWPAQYGGTTECRIYPTLVSLDPLKTTYGEPIAFAEALCGRSDQFDRRIGRLVSLALALSKSDVNLSEKWAILTNNVRLTTDGYMHKSQVDPLFDAWHAQDQSAVKTVCAKIVESWKPKHDDWRDAIRSLYREAMRLCHPDANKMPWLRDARAVLDDYTDLLRARQAKQEQLRGYIMTRNRREVAEVCAEIVKDWRQRRNE